jgi:hypothetical protein
MRKRATDLLREANELRKKANELRQHEKKRERTEGRLRTALLGALYEQRLANDAAERARVNIELKGFLKSPEHRELFRIDAASTYIDDLPEQLAARRAKREERKAARASNGRGDVAEEGTQQRGRAAVSKERGASANGPASSFTSASAGGGDGARAGARVEPRVPANGADGARTPLAGRDASGVRANAAPSTSRVGDPGATTQAAGGAS